MKSTVISRSAALAAIALAAALPATTAIAADHFAGKSIMVTVGTGPGGGYDRYARTVARHLPNHIPGKPNVIVQNMPGAGSAKAAAYIYKVAPKDGTAIGAIFPGAIMGPLTKPKLAEQYDSTKFNYIGSADSGWRVCITFHKSKIKSMADAMKMQTVVGASASGGSTADYAMALNALAGTKFKVIAGYSGSKAILLAVEKGEVDGLCGYDWTSLNSARSAWIKEKKISILVQAGLDNNPQLTKMGVPNASTFLKTERQKAIYKLLVSEQKFGRPYVLAPGTDPKVVKILQTAFNATMKDAAFLKDAKKVRLAINPATGPEVQKLVEGLYASPKDLVKAYTAAKLGKN
jgi:tripartite-type tricarboxylate transporter receptor subunit TctC